MQTIGLFCAGLLLCSVSAQAHEFWIAPDDHEVELGQEISLDLKVGQMFEGRSYPYLSHKIVSYEISNSEGTLPVQGNEGDIPSVVYQPRSAGLHIASYHATPEEITYEEMGSFSEYLAEEGHDSLISRHHERGLPDSGFTETYTRNAKALIQVGDVKQSDNDKAVGLPFELVALENPYLNNRQSLRVMLFWQGRPAANAQIAVFRKTEPAAAVRTTVRTNGEGIATIPLSGGGDFLLSAVYFEESNPETGAAWHSTWASLAFGLPGDKANAE